MGKTLLYPGRNASFDSEIEALIVKERESERERGRLTEKEE